MKRESPERLPEVMVRSAQELAECCARLADCPHLGFDTEFVGEETYHPRLCLVQVATDEHLYLIDPLSAGPLDPFWKLLLDPQRVVVVHAGREEVRLCRLWTGFVPANLFDLQLAAGLAGLHFPLGHGHLVQQVVGVTLPKGETLTEWRTRPLTPGQIRYALDDVRYLLPAWRKLTTELTARNRLDWAREEFARLKEQAAPEEIVGERWRKLKGIGALDRRKLAVVRALYQWREETADRTNRPVRAILRDDLLIEIAKRNPTRERDLQVIRGLPKRDLAEIVEVAVAARHLPAEQLPAPCEREQDPPQVALVAAIVNAVLADFCARQGLSQSLVATTSDVRQLVRARAAGEPLPADCALTQGWRAAHVLPELLAVLEGRRTLRIADIAADAPLAYQD